jgi:hypothetical protein
MNDEVPTTNNVQPSVIFAAVQCANVTYSAHSLQYMKVEISLDVVSCFFSFMHLPPHLIIAVHNVLLHFSLLPSIFTFFIECIVPIWYILNVTELNLYLFWAGL